MRGCNQQVAELAVFTPPQTKARRFLQIWRERGRARCLGLFFIISKTTTPFLPKALEV